MFFATISEEILRIYRATSSVVQFIKTSMLRHAADSLGTKKALVKIIKRQLLQFKNAILTTEI